MNMKICAYACVVCLVLCSTALAGPLDNASQFQRKAAVSAINKPSDNAWKYTTTQPVRQTGKGIISPPADLRLEDTASTSDAAEDTPLSLRLEAPADTVAPGSQNRNSR